MIKVIGVKIIDRIKEAGLTQLVLSRHANLITTRLGFHEVTDELCSREAYIILHLNGNPSDTDMLISELKSVGGTELREMNFEAEDNYHPDKPSEHSVEIIGLLIERDETIIKSVQKTLTSYGCNIRTRLGVNETFFGKPAGLIILELKGEQKQRQLLEKDLRSLKHVHVRSMIF
jgi:hypothetical protein